MPARATASVFVKVLRSSGKLIVGVSDTTPPFTFKKLVVFRERIVELTRWEPESATYVDLTEVIGTRLHLKCEGFNFAGSIKLKAAVEMVEVAERSGVLRPDSVLVESSSGNLGVALSALQAMTDAAQRDFFYVTRKRPRS